MKHVDSVEIIEVSPRDGIQNEKNFIPTEDKVAFINAINKTGVKRIEASSFVHPKYVPQMADAQEVVKNIKMDEDIQYMVLIPNEKGYERAHENNINALNLVVGASDTFNQRNVRMSRDQSMIALEKIIHQAKKNGAFVRYSIATSFWCPFEGEVKEEIVLKMIDKVEAIGIDEFTICDTIGKANPKQVYRLFKNILDLSPKAKISAHFHDTYGMAQANVIASLEAGVRSFDSAIGGLGGCPFAPGAAGNLSTEDLVYMLHNMGIETGIDINRLLEAVSFIKPLTNRELTGHLYKVSEGCIV